MHRIFAGLAFWTTVALVGQFVLGWYVGRAVRAGEVETAQSLFTWHMLIGVGVGTLTTVLHVMTLFHFIGSGKEIKEHAAVLGDTSDIIKRLRRFKMLTSPLATFAPLFTGAAVILGGGAHMKQLHLGEMGVWNVPGWIHWAVAIVALAFNLVAFPVEYKCLKLNNELIAEVDARVRREVAPPMFREEAAP